jgi:hypothetical protein
MLQKRAREYIKNHNRSGSSIGRTNESIRHWRIWLHRRIGRRKASRYGASSPGIVRSEEKARLLKERGIEPIIGTLDDAAEEKSACDTFRV